MIFLISVIICEQRVKYRGNGVIVSHSPCSSQPFSGKVVWFSSGNVVKIESTSPDTTTFRHFRRFTPCPGELMPWKTRSPPSSRNPRRRDKLPESVDDFRFLIFRESSLRLFYTFCQPSEVFPIDPTTINPTPLLSFLENETISRNFLNDEGNENDSILIFFRENDNPLVLI